MDAPIPGGPWLRVWITGFAVALVFLGGLELFWRAKGHTPSIVSETDLWCYQRERIDHCGPNTIALLGGSRMLEGFIPEVFLKDHPEYETVQLALVGSSPFAVLRDLANEKSFRGLVICSIVTRTMQPSRLEDQQRFVEAFHHDWGPSRKANLFFSAFLQERLVLLRPHLAGRGLFEAIDHRKLPKIARDRMYFDRRRVLNSELIVPEVKIARGAQRLRRELAKVPPCSGEEWNAVIAKVASLVKRIESHGGRVVFVRFPVRDERKEVVDEFFPRKKYWDVFARFVGTDVIHDEDLPGTAALKCPDGSHLGPNDAVEFTRILARELAKRGYIK